MIQIPKQLQNEAFRFNLVQKKEKKPVEKDWTIKNNYKFNDSKLIEHLNGGGNYGVLGCFGKLIIIDCDDELASTLVKESLPKTFTVKASKLPHFYYICKDGKNLKVFKNSLKTKTINKPHAPS